MFSSNADYLTELLATFDINCQLDLADCVRHLVNDSREVNKHDIFCAVQGTITRGSCYIQQAIENGCDLVIVECETAAEHGQLKPIKGQTRDSLQLSFYQLNKKLFALSQAFYRHPDEDLMMIGITGTNGKTTTSQLIAQLLNAGQFPCAVIGTNGAGSLTNLMALANTTPAATKLNQLLHDFTLQQYCAVAMEVSSHALAQHRVDAELFDIAIFTNLSRDHLDYHQTMENYGAAKYQLFANQSQQISVVNGDDKQGKDWLVNWPKDQKVIVYGQTQAIRQYQQFVQATNVSYQSNGVSFNLMTERASVLINSPLLGSFNIDNLLAAICVLIIRGVDLPKIADMVAFISPISGRMECFFAEQNATAIVDYAHTPDALQKALLACRQHCQGELWVVFGCGGDRDKGKRAAMGHIAEQWSDHVIITSDNPRSEDKRSISKDILSGCQQPEKITVNLDRPEAVLSTLKRAKVGDIVLLAGKGHEQYIIDGAEQVPYSERELVSGYYVSGENEATK